MLEKISNSKEMTVMSNSSFVHLHVHSDSSSFLSCAKIDDLVEKAKVLNMTALAITDTGNMSGVPYFKLCCNQNEIKPIIGQEFYVKGFNANNSNSLYKLVLLCQNETGYKNLCKLSSASYEEVTSEEILPRINWQLLNKYHKGLICLSGGAEGEIAQLLLDGKEEVASNIARKYKELLDDECFYIELQNHKFTKEQIVIKKLAALAHELNIPLVATNDIYYLEKEDSKAQEVLSCIGQNTTLSEPHKKLGDKIRESEENNSEWYFKSQEEMSILFADYPEALENTVKIADICNLEIKEYTSQECIENLPCIKIPEEFHKYADDTKRNQNDYLRFLVEQGLKNRYETITKQIQERADYELDIIFQKNFTGYFLILWEIVSWAKSTWDNVNNCEKPYIPIGPGRGASPESLINYALGITEIDPLKYNLYFERFINSVRDNLPDIDIDVDDDYRELIIQHLRDLYGEQCIKNIIVIGTLNASDALSKVGQVLRLPSSEIAKIKDAIPDYPRATFADIFDSQNKYIARYKDLFDIANRLERVKIYTDLHASGILIHKTGADSCIPFAKDSCYLKRCTQYPYELETVGLIKFDFLGFRTLTLIRHTEELINTGIRPEDEKFSVSTIDENDSKTFELFKHGDTAEIYLFDSPSMKKLLMEFQPDTIEDLAVLNSLYRPGNMEYIPQIMNGKCHPEKINYIDDFLKDILAETYGIIVYQEQIMNMLQVVAGYSLSEADIIRRELGKRRADLVSSRKREFIARVVQKGYAESKAEELFKEIYAKVAYAYNKSHAIAYTKLSYQTAYLKAHYPAEFAEAEKL